MYFYPVWIQNDLEQLGHSIINKSQRRAQLGKTQSKHPTDSHQAMLHMACNAGVPERIADIKSSATTIY